MHLLLCRILASIRVILVLEEIRGVLREDVASAPSPTEADNIALNVVLVDGFPNNRCVTKKCFWIIDGIGYQAVRSYHILIRKDEANADSFAA